MKVIISSQSPILGRIRLWLSWFKLKCHLLVLIYDRRWFLRVLHSEKLIESHKNRIHSFNPRWLIFSYILTKTSTDTCGSIVIKFGSLVEHLKKTSVCGSARSEILRTLRCWLNYNFSGCNFEIKLNIAYNSVYHVVFLIYLVIEPYFFFNSRNEQF